MTAKEEREDFQPVQLLNYTQADYEAVKQILEESELFDPIWDSEKRLNKRIQEKPDSIIIATIGDNVVGNVFIVDDFYPYVFRLIVRQTYRRQGIGMQLMDKAIEKLKEHGHTEIGIFVDD